jgi:hypothetical protein
MDPVGKCPNEEQMTNTKTHTVAIAACTLLFASEAAANPPVPSPDAPSHPSAAPGYGIPPSPSELEYREGGAVPDGYVVERRVNKALVIAGASTFGGVYLLTTLGAAIAVDTSEDDAAIEPLFIPVAGPFVAIHTTDASATGTFGLVVDGLAQAAGLGMFVAGFAAQDEVLVWRGLGVAVRPDVGPGGARLTATF